MNLTSMTKIDVGRLVCVNFHLNRCRFAVAVAKYLGGSLLLGHSVYYSATTLDATGVRIVVHNHDETLYWRYKNVTVRSGVQAMSLGICTD